MTNTPMIGTSGSINMTFQMTSDTQYLKIRKCVIVLLGAAFQVHVMNPK